MERGSFAGPATQALRARQLQALRKLDPEQWGLTQADRESSGHLCSRKVAGEVGVLRQLRRAQLSTLAAKATEAGPGTAVAVAFAYLMAICLHYVAGVKTHREQLAVGFGGEFLSTWKLLRPDLEMWPDLYFTTGLADMAWAGRGKQPRPRF